MKAIPKYTMSVGRGLLAFEVLLIAGVCSTLFARVTSTAEEKLNVHIIPHTHDDVGWTSTVDQYYIDGELLPRHTSKATHYGAHGGKIFVPLGNFCVP